mmetsp:Transcript_45583/g.74286  ORF Transcript_45583/g.74286 Transcript_45583/m.74286 type:complete len:83 (+) Transcript_45583:1843-2091(+)
MSWIGPAEPHCRRVVNDEAAFAEAKSEIHSMHTRIAERMIRDDKRERLPSSKKTDIGVERSLLVLYQPVTCQVALSSSSVRN